MSTQAIICRRCNVASQIVIANTKPKETVCPQCGASEKYEVTMRMLQVTMHGKVQDMLCSAVKGSKSITYKPGRTPNSNSKFRLGS